MKSLIVVFILIFSLPSFADSLLEEYTALANRGDVKAQKTLAIQYLIGYTGYGIYYTGGINHKEGVRWLTRVAERGRPDSQEWLARIYYYGEKAPQDFKKALGWLTKAATQRGDYHPKWGYLTKWGDYYKTRYPQHKLGVMYRNGEGTPQDFKEALRWFTKAAQQGHSEAQYELGVMYYNGEGVNQDYKRALRWFTKAARRGHSKAQHELSVMYRNGEGTTREKKR